MADRRSVKNCGKKLLLSLTSLLLFLLLLCIVEGVLSLTGIPKEFHIEDTYVGFSSKLPLFVEKELASGRRAMVTAQNKLPYFNYQEFPRQKSHNAYRIFCLGGSTTYGRPYSDFTSFCGWLREILRVLDSRRQWEVINAGGISYASYRVALLMEELSQYQPDLFIVYTGNNEFLEKRTYHLLSRVSPTILDWSHYLTRTRTYRLLGNVVQRRAAAQEKEARGKYLMTEEVADLLEQAVGPTQYSRGAFNYEGVFRHYEFNVERMGRLARAVGAKIIFVRPAYSLKGASPFKSEHKLGISAQELSVWEEHFERGKELLDQGNPGLAADAFAQAVAIDPQHAHLQYLYGRSLFLSGQYSKAKESFQKAVDEDICPLRAIFQIGALCLNLRELGITVIDYPRLLEDLCEKRYGHRVLGEEFFLDHVHPTLESHRILALAILKEMTSLGIIANGDRVPDHVVSNVVGRVMGQVDPAVHAMALHNLAKVLSWAGKKEEAARIATKALEVVPHHPENLLLVGAALALKGRLEEALQKYLRAIELNPDQREAQRRTGEVLIKLGRANEAYPYYLEALKKDQTNPDIHHQLGCILLKRNQTQEAIHYFQSALKLNSTNISSHFNLGMAFQSQKRWEKARRHFKQVLTANPKDWEAVLRLGDVEYGMKHWAKAEELYRAALRLQPFLKQAKVGLGRVLFELERREESAGYWKAVLILDPANEEAKRYLEKIEAIRKEYR